MNAHACFIEAVLTRHDCHFSMCAHETPLADVTPSWLRRRHAGRRVCVHDGAAAARGAAVRGRGRVVRGRHPWAGRGEVPHPSLVTRCHALSLLRTHAHTHSARPMHESRCAKCCDHAAYQSTDVLMMRAAYWRWVDRQAAAHVTCVKVHVHGSSIRPCHTTAGSGWDGS